MIMPPSSSMFTWVTRPLSSLHRPVSSNPNAFAIQSAARPTSSYENIGTTRCSAIEAHLNRHRGPGECRGLDPREWLVLALLLSVGVGVTRLVGVTARTVIARSFGAGFGRVVPLGICRRRGLLLERSRR